MTIPLHDTEAYALAKVKKGTIIFVPILPAQNNVLLPAAPHRSRITISHNGTGFLFISNSVMVNLNQGLCIPQNTQPLSLCISDVGDIVTQAWYAWSTLACTVTILETEWSADV